MATRELPKISDVDRESEYGYVFGVSGPGQRFWIIQILYCCMPTACIMVCACVT